MTRNKFVIVAMSGGVDSTITAYLLKNKGFHVEGIFMKNWNKDDNNYCNSLEDLFYAKLAADKLNIKLHTVNFSEEYWNKVFKITINKYLSGKTPNPDVLCNKEIKFKVLIEYSKNKFNMDYISTGHYVRNIVFNKNNFIFKSIDEDKDQSYFLYNLNKNNIKLCLFPLGYILKKNVRKIAKLLNLENYNRKSSTGICFIGKRIFKKFLNRFIPFNSGKIITKENCSIGIHDGLPFYTIGQRKGLKIGGIKNYLPNPWYVIDKNIKNNTLIVSQDINLLFKSKGLIANSVNWINKFFIIDKLIVKAKIRYSKNEVLCEIKYISKYKVMVIFKYPYGIVVLGQSIVFYINKCCIGGGIIESEIK